MCCFEPLGFGLAEREVARVLFSNPLMGDGFNVSYSRFGVETDLPALEPAPQCSHVTGAGCSLFPQVDDGVPAAFCPFFNAGCVGERCVWTMMKSRSQ